MNGSVKNELYRDLLGINGLNPFDGGVSSSRKQMFANHLGQALVIKGSTERYCQTGLEREFAKYTFSVKTPGNIEVLKIIEKYPQKIGPDSIGFTPNRLVVYRDVDSGELGVINLPTYECRHQYFGYEYKVKDALRNLHTGQFVKKDTILLDSPNVTDDGGYKYGVESNICYMSHPAVSEDGILVSKEYLEKLKFKIYETRVVEFGSKKFPLNLYGDIDNYKPFPEIGTCIREDGLLMALRSYNKELAPIDQNIYSLMRVDYIFDKLTYVSGAGGRVINVKVHHDQRNTQSDEESGMDAQVRKYHNANLEYYKAIHDTYNSLQRQYGDNFSHEFHQLMFEAIAILDTSSQVQKNYRQVPMDVWRVEFVIEYEVTPDIGFKLTDTSGSKGVICKILPRADMPVDKAGNIADLVMDPISKLNRANSGSLMEPFINASARDVVKKIMVDLQLGSNPKENKEKIKHISQNDKPQLQKVWDYLMGFYQIISPDRMYAWLTHDNFIPFRIEHLNHILQHGITGIPVHLPPENSPEYEEMVAQLTKYYPSTYGPVTYTGNSGNRVTTVNPVRIGSTYIMLLEKTGDDWAAVASAKLQHFGMIAQVTNNDKYSHPSRLQSVRVWGEAESRLGVSYAGPEFMADVNDRNGNITTHKQIINSVLRADKPTDIPLAVDRQTSPLGGVRALAIVKHLLECSGVRFKYTPYIPNKRNFDNEKVKR